MRPAAVLLALSAAGCSLLAPQPPPAARVSLDSREVFYDIEGRSADELYAQMRAKGVREGRAVLFGEYRWDLDWNYRYAAAWYGGGCYMTEVQVKLRAQAVLPRWGAPTPALQRQWTAFSEALRRHQKGHAELAARAAEDIKAGLQAVVAPSCEALPAVADGLARGRLKEHRAAHERYDLETRQGARQGAVWPPAPG